MVMCMSNESVTSKAPVGQSEITEMVEKLVGSDWRFTYLYEANDEVHFEDCGGRLWSIKVCYRGSRTDGLC
jgi:hypothetical protein